MEWLVCCTVLSIGFHSKLRKLLLPLYDDVPPVLDSIGYRLVHEIGQFRKLLLPLYDDVPPVLDSIRYRLVHGIGQFSFIHGISLTTLRKTPPSIYRCSRSFGLNPISIGSWNWTIQFYLLDFTQNSPNYSSLYIVMFPKFWIQYDIDWSMELDNSGSYEVRSEMEWLVYCIVLTIGFT
ncbi:unnamed protein product [Prunus armeniaca]